MTAPIPAICKSCGAVFPSGFVVSGATVIGCESGPCPKCGGMGVIPDGTYETIGNVIRLLAGPQRTVDQLRAIASTLSAAREAVANPAESIEKIKSEAPELASIADTLPKTRMELYAFLSLLISAISTIITAAVIYFDRGPSEAEVQQMVDKSIERAFEEKPAEEKKQPYRAVPEPGRNEPCPCGSGKKYKHCCLRLS